MSNASKKAAPMSHWLISGAALLWNMFGFVIFAMTVSLSPEELAAVYTEDQVRFLEAIPMWATAANAAAVTLGIIGCILLFMRSSLATLAFIGSLVALIVQDIHSFVLNDAIGLFGPHPAYIQGAVFIVAVALVIYARGARQKGVLA